MVPSKQNRSCLLSAPRVFLLLLLHTFHAKGDGGANFTIVNECSETIWAVVEDATSGGGGFSNCVVNGSVSCNSGRSQTTTTTRYMFQVGPSRSAAFDKQNGWNGRVWGRTGCDSNAGTCGTGDAADATRAEFGLGPSKFDRRDYYDVSLVDGYNLGMVVKPSGGSGPCRSAGCAEDLNESCPPELSTGGGAACRGPCAVFGTQEYCCTEEQQPCGPTNYSLLFKKLCPRTSTYPKDDTAATLFSCTVAHYSVIFCPPSASLLEEISPAPAQSFDNNPQERRGIHLLPPFTIIAPGLRGEISDSCLKTFVAVATRCLHYEPKKRITMTRAVAQLELALEQQERRGTATSRFQFWPFRSRVVASGSTQKDEPQPEVTLSPDTENKQNSAGTQPRALRKDHSIEELPIYVPAYDMIWPSASRVDKTVDELPTYPSAFSLAELEDITQQRAIRVNHTVDELPIHVPAFSLAKLEDITHGFSLNHMIAKGLGGELIFRGVLKSN